jgi:hypothetical protein
MTSVVRGRSRSAAFMVLVAMTALCAGCKRRESAVPVDTTAASDGGVGEPVGLWRCDAAPLAEGALPHDAILGIPQLSSDGARMTIAYAGGDAQGRRHRALVLAPAVTSIDGPPVDGDAPPWVSVAGARAQRFVRLSLTPSPRVVLTEGAATVAEVPLVLGDELAVDAIATTDRAWFAVTEARGVVLRAWPSTEKSQDAVFADATSPVLLAGSDGAVVLVGRVDESPAKEELRRDVPVAALEGSGEERTAASLVAWGARGDRVASLSLAAGAELLGPALARRAVLIATRRVLRGEALADVDAWTAAGKKLPIAQVPVRRGSRLVPIDDAAAPAGVSSDILELADQRVTVLGRRRGTLPTGSVEAVLGARVSGDTLDVWLTRDDDSGASARHVRCSWSTP